MMLDLEAFRQIGQMLHRAKLKRIRALAAEADHMMVMMHQAAGAKFDAFAQVKLLEHAHVGQQP
jgi:hypothetical protein